jgi:hypothetical protein
MGPARKSPDKSDKATSAKAAKKTGTAGKAAASTRKKSVEKASKASSPKVAKPKAPGKKSAGKPAVVMSATAAEPGGEPAWFPDDPPYIYLRTPSGASLHDPQQPAEPEYVAWRADGLPVVQMNGWAHRKGQSAEYFREGLVVYPDGHTQGGMSAYLHPDGRRAVRIRNGCAELIDLDGTVLSTSEKLADDAGRNGGQSMGWSPSGSHFVVGNSGLFYVVSFDPPWSKQVSIGVDSARIVAVLDDRRVLNHSAGESIWDVATGTCELRHRNENIAFGGAAAVSPDGKEVVFGGTALQWAPAEDITQLQAIDVGKTRFTEVLGFSPDGSLLLVRSAFARMQVIDWPGGASRQELLMGKDSIYCAAVSRDNRRLVAASRGVLYFWCRDRKARPPPERPKLEECSVPAARREPSGLIPTTAEELEAGIESIEFFSKLGQPLSFDGSLVRIGSFDAWPGSESECVVSLQMQEESWWQAARAAMSAAAVTEDRLERIRVRAARLAERNVQPGPEDDPTSPREVCIAEASTVMRTAAAFLLLGWEWPPDLVEVYLLYRAGHWPCGYGESTSLECPTKLMVY